MSGNGERIKQKFPGSDDSSDLYLYIRDGVIDPGGSIREAVYLFTSGNACEHQGGTQAALGASDNISIHTVTDHQRVFRMRLEGS